MKDTKMDLNSVSCELMGLCAICSFVFGESGFNEVDGERNIVRGRFNDVSGTGNTVTGNHNEIG